MDTDQVLELIQDVAEEVLNPRFRALEAHHVIEKNPGDLVTIADREAEERLTAALQTAYPEAVVLGEEATAADADLLSRFVVAEHAFTIDPVDGTKNFVAGSPDHAVMVAEVRGGVVVRSWIWQPQHARAYVAERGSGAWCDGQRLVRDQPPAEPVGVTSSLLWVGQVLGRLQELSLSWACCGVDYPKLIEGAVDYVLYSGANPWDHAPGSLLLTEAGGFLGTAHGVEYGPTQGVSGPLVAAADRATFARVTSLLGTLSVDGT